VQSALAPSPSRRGERQIGGGDHRIGITATTVMSDGGGDRKQLVIEAGCTCDDELHARHGGFHALRAGNRIGRMRLTS